MEKTDNPVVRLVMEIIQRDSQMHHRIQEFIADSLESKAITLTPDEIGEVWELIEKHIALEKDTVRLAKESLEATEGKKGLTVQRYLLEYLLTDEEKHNTVLERLESIKKDMYPYG
jgi:ferritin-like protein